MLSMKKKRNRKLKIPIPLDYAELLEYDPSNLSHINAGRRRLLHLPAKQIERTIRILEAAKEDDRLKGMKLLDLIPELKKLLPYLRV